MHLRLLPAIRKIHNGHRVCAGIAIVCLYLLIGTFIVSRCIKIYKSVENMPDTVSMEGNDWGNMSYLTVCVDPGTNNTITKLLAVVPQGFNRTNNANA